MSQTPPTADQIADDKFYLAIYNESTSLDKNPPPSSAFIFLGLIVAFICCLVGGVIAYYAVKSKYITRFERLVRITIASIFILGGIAACVCIMLFPGTEQAKKDDEEQKKVIREEYQQKPEFIDMQKRMALFPTLYE